MAYRRILPLLKRLPNVQVFCSHQALLPSPHIPPSPQKARRQALTIACRQEFHIQGHNPPLTVHCSAKGFHLLPEQDILDVIQRSADKLRNHENPNMEMPQGENHPWICRGRAQGTGPYFDIYLREARTHSFTYGAGLRVLLQAVAVYHERNRYWGQSICQIRMTPVASTRSFFMGIAGISEGSARETCPRDSPSLSSD